MTNSDTGHDQDKVARQDNCDDDSWLTLYKDLCMLKSICCSSRAVIQCAGPLNHDSLTYASGCHGSPIAYGPED